MFCTSWPMLRDSERTCSWSEKSAKGGMSSPEKWQWDCRGELKRREVATVWVTGTCKNFQECSEVLLEGGTSSNVDLIIFIYDQTGWFGKRRHEHPNRNAGLTEQPRQAFGKVNLYACILFFLTSSFSYLLQKNESQGTLPFRHPLTLSTTDYIILYSINLFVFTMFRYQKIKKMIKTLVLELKDVICKEGRKMLK